MESLDRKDRAGEDEPFLWTSSVPSKLERNKGALRKKIAGVVVTSLVCGWLAMRSIGLYGLQLPRSPKQSCAKEAASGLPWEFDWDTVCLLLTPYSDHRSLIEVHVD